MASSLTSGTDPACGRHCAGTCRGRSLHGGARRHREAPGRGARRLGQYRIQVLEAVCGLDEREEAAPRQGRDLRAGKPVPQDCRTHAVSTRKRQAGHDAETCRAYSERVRGRHCRPRNGGNHHALSRNHQPGDAALRLPPGTAQKGEAHRDASVPCIRIIPGCWTPRSASSTASAGQSASSFWTSVPTTPRNRKTLSRSATGASCAMSLSTILPMPFMSGMSRPPGKRRKACCVP